MSQQLAASHKSIRDGENFLRNALESCLNYCSAQEQKCREYWELYQNMEAKYGSAIKETHTTTMKVLNLQQELERADSINDATNRRAEDLHTSNTNLAKTNLSLQQDLNQAHEVIRDLKKRIMELESPPGVATGSKNTDIHELDTVVQVSSDARTMELTQPEGEDNGLDAQETDSTIALMSTKVSPFLDDGGRQKAGESQTIGEQGSQKHPKRRGRKRKLAPLTPGLG
jgi:hypothetical protein